MYILQVLGLEKNAFKFLPVCIHKMQGLRMLSLSFNEIDEVADDIGYTAIISSFMPYSVNSYLFPSTHGFLFMIITRSAHLCIIVFV